MIKRILNYFCWECKTRRKMDNADYKLEFNLEFNIESSGNNFKRHSANFRIDGKTHLGVAIATEEFPTMLIKQVLRQLSPQLFFRFSEFS